MSHKQRSLSKTVCEHKNKKMAAAEQLFIALNQLKVNIQLQLELERVESFRALSVSDLQAKARF